jgi:hypothetical protein
MNCYDKVIVSLLGISIVLLYLLIGIKVLMALYDFDNPVYKPLFILFWPVILLAALFWVIFGNWIEETIDYYREKKERKNDSQI